MDYRSYLYRLARAGFLVMLFAWAGINLAAQNLQEIIPVNSRAYGMLDNIIMESGHIPLSAVRPYTKAQFLLAMALVDKDQLSDQGVAQYNRLTKLLEPRSLYVEQGQFAFSGGVSVGLEAYFHTNQSHGELYKGYGNRIPLLSIPFSLDFADAVSLAADFNASEETLVVPQDNLNIPRDIGYFELEQPMFTNVSIGNDHFNLSMGRNQVTIGPGNFSKLLVSDNADFLEYISLKTFWNVFTFSVFVFDMDPSILPTDQALVSDGTILADQAPVKNYFLHRTELSLFDQRLNIAISEGFMIGGAYPEMKYFNPLMVLHDFYDWSHGSSEFGVDFNWNPWKYINVYGQMIFNKFQTTYELNVYNDTGSPNARGFMGGIMFNYPVGPGYLSAYGEVWYTDPWLYVRENTLSSYVWRRRAISNLIGTGAPFIISKPLGFKYGPDTEAFNVTIVYDWQDLLHTELDMAYVMKGQQTIDSYAAKHTGEAAVKMVTPSGIPENTLSFILSAAFTPFDWLQIDGSLATYFIQNQGHVPGVQGFDLQGSIGVQFFLGRKPYQRR